MSRTEFVLSRAGQPIRCGDVVVMTSVVTGFMNAEAVFLGNEDGSDGGYAYDNDLETLGPITSEPAHIDARALAIGRRAIERRRLAQGLPPYWPSDVVPGVYNPDTPLAATGHLIARLRMVLFRAARGLAASRCPLCAAADSRALVPGDCMRCLGTGYVTAADPDQKPVGSMLTTEDRLALDACERSYLEPPE